MLLKNGLTASKNVWHISISYSKFLFRIHELEYHVAITFTFDLDVVDLGDEAHFLHISKTIRVSNSRRLIRVIIQAYFDMNSISFPINKYEIMLAGLCCSISTILSN